MCSGTALHYIEDPKFKTTTMTVAIHRPLSREEASLNALLPMVLKRGCIKYPTLGQVERRLQELYGAQLHCSVTKKGDDQILIFSMQTIQDGFTPDGRGVLLDAAELLLSVIFDPALENGIFSSEYVAQEKNNLSDMIHALVNEKRMYARMRCVEEMCAGDPFGIHELGSRQELDKVTPQSLYAHYQEILTSSRFDIFVCGRANAAAFAQWLKEKLSGRCGADVAYPGGTILKRSGEVRRITDTFDVNQAKLVLGLRTNTQPTGEEFYQLAVANSILGSGVHSKLFNNVREKLSLAYYAASSLVRSKGLMLIDMGIEEGKFQQAFDETLLQLDALKNGEVSDYEFDSAKVFLINNAQSAKDNQYALIDFHLGELVMGQQGGLDAYAEGIGAVTKQQAVDAAKKIELDTVYLLGGQNTKQAV